ncbi:unnamed protein product [Tilletia controversa]|uniref:Sister chromatid cohesion protein DCC1 n=3 Tax=Tilletia TaxID=13289 RepID=A0A8X7MQF6_9BASI|nr:hypothetical protein CF336_g5013 [Tilletia laevis]KAE8194300.1 hypothetical protein CF328_g4793 [Tilletia controversa]KAE8258264.1 hypothetical protein A4X03_0g4433 [Tilletia caries]KAE8198245.1 hypothetical protein CF335_g4429 [Tilletia laevis]KAE8245618.1 hypothetical protein A4X06_0g5542 [Tilletia controversa]
MTDRVSVLTAPTEGDAPSYLLLQVPKDLIASFDPPQSAASDEASSTGPTKRKREEDAGRDLTKKCSSFAINGRHSDSAVLCTDTASYTIRQISQSNSLLLLTPSSDLLTGSTTLHLKASLETILELVPSVPRLSRIPDLLRPTAFAGPEEEVELQERILRDEGTKRKLKTFTHRQLRSIVQASEAEFVQALCEFRVIQLGSRLRLIAASYRVKLLKLIHAQLMLDSLSSSRVPVEAMTKTLAKENNVPEAITRAALLKWYGEPIDTPEAPKGEADGNTAEMACLRSEPIARDIGLELLSKHRTPTSLPTFLSEWKKAVGELFEDHAQIALLRGYSLLHPSALPVALFPPPGTVASAPSLHSNSASAGALTATPELVNPTSIQYYPASLLPSEPAQRFAELFLTRPHWTQDELLPFLEDLAPGPSSTSSQGSKASTGGKKDEEDKQRKSQRKVIDSFLMKFTRSRTVKLAEPAVLVIKDEATAAATAATAGTTLPKPIPSGGMLMGGGTFSSLKGAARKRAAAAAAAAAVASQVCKDIKVYSARMKY